MRRRRISEIPRRLGLAKTLVWRFLVDFVDVTFRRKVTYLAIPSFNNNKALGRIASNFGTRHYRQTVDALLKATRKAMK